MNNLREGIYHEFKKCGKVKSVVIRGDNNSRNALVLFRNSTEANKAISHAKTKLLFGAAIEASLYDGEGKLGVVRERQYPKRLLLQLQFMVGPTVAALADSEPAKVTIYQTV